MRIAQFITFNCIVLTSLLLYCFISVICRLESAFDENGAIQDMLSHDEVSTYLLSVSNLEDVLYGDSDSASASSLVGSHDSLLVDEQLIPDDLRTPVRTRLGKIPRLLKNDLRRFFPSMFINAINSQDRKLLIPYMEKFYVPNASLELLRDLSVVWNVNNPSTTHSNAEQMIPTASRGELVKGRERITTYFLLLFRSFPDMCLSLGDIEIKRNNISRRGKVHFRFSASWTDVVPVQSLMPTEYTSQSSSIIWEEYAYELEAEDVFDLDENWYITQINSCTLSSSVVRKS